MPRTIPLSEVLKMDAGESVVQTKGLLEKVFERKTGTNKNGEWSLQNAVLKDGGSEIKICLSGRAAGELEPLKGREIWLISNKSEKHGLTGLKVEDNNWTDKSGNAHSDKIIKVTASAVIARSDTAQAAANTESSPDDDDQVPGAEVKAPPATRPAARQTPAAVGSWKDTGSKILRLGELYAACTSAVVTHVAPKVLAKSGYAMGPDHLQAAAASLFIEFNRKFGLDMIPESPLPVPTKTAPTKPAPAPLVQSSICDECGEALTAENMCVNRNCPQCGPF